MFFKEKVAIEQIKEFAKRDPDAFFEKYDSNLNKAVNKYSGSGVDKAVLKSKAESLALNAANTYDPNKGASFDTHLYGELRRLYRETNKMQTPLRISEYSKMKYHENPDAKIFNIEKGFDSGENSFLDKGVFDADSTSKLKRTLSMVNLTPSEKKLSEILMDQSVSDKTADIAAKLNITPSTVTKLKQRIAVKIAPFLKDDKY